jgi:hypothetical protein
MKISFDSQDFCWLFDVQFEHEENFKKRERFQVNYCGKMGSGFLQTFHGTSEEFAAAFV